MAFTLNGTDISAYLSDPGESIVEVAVVKQMANGRHRKANRAFKRQWALTCIQVTNAQRSALQTIALLTTTFTLVDQHGVNYTVMTEPGSYSARVSLIEPGSPPTLHYDVQLTCIQE